MVFPQAERVFKSLRCIVGCQCDREGWIEEEERESGRLRNRTGAREEETVIEDADGEVMMVLAVVTWGNR